MTGPRGSRLCLDPAPTGRGVSWHLGGPGIAWLVTRGVTVISEAVGGPVTSRIRAQHYRRAAGLDESGQPRERRRPGRIPPSRFGVVLGLAGLGSAWYVAGAKLGTPPAVPDAINVVAAAALLVLGGLYAMQGPRQVLADLRDPVQAPFVVVASLTAMILAAALARHSFTAGRTLVVIFLAVTIGGAGWLIGQWMNGDLDMASVHSGYYLPAVGGGLLGASMLAQVHLHALAEAAFGLGIVSWLIVGSVVLTRLFSARRLPAALVPTMAIEIAPPAMAGVAYFALARPGITLIAYAIGGYAVLMALAQIRLIPVYFTLRFSPGFWSFTFPCAITVTYALEWITRANPPGAIGYTIVAITAITALIATIAARSVVATAQGRFLTERADSGQLADLPQQVRRESGTRG
jgi:tellurite resistance protein